jgi:hypothetical protein
MFESDGFFRVAQNLLCRIVPAVAAAWANNLQNIFRNESALIIGVIDYDLDWCLTPVASETKIKGVGRRFHRLPILFAQGFISSISESGEVHAIVAESFPAPISSPSLVGHFLLLWRVQALRSRLVRNNVIPAKADLSH